METLSATEVAQQFNVHLNTVLRWIESDSLPGATKPKGSRSWLIPKASVEARQRAISRELEEAREWGITAGRMEQYASEVHVSALEYFLTAVRKMNAWGLEYETRVNRENDDPSRDSRFLQSYQKALADVEISLGVVRQVESLDSVLNGLESRAKRTMAAADRRMDVDYNGPRSEVE